MADILQCDGCGAAIRNGPEDQINRLRLIDVHPRTMRERMESIWDRANDPTWDFCNVHCLATWAVQKETETVK